VRLAGLPAGATALGVGGGPLGGLFTAVSEADAEATVARAWEQGLRYFDVAPLYGHGRAERVVGAGLRGKPRGDYVLSTKVGRLLRPEGAGRPTDFADPGELGPVFDFSRDGVQRSHEESLGRLGLDRVDIAYLHDPEQHLEQALTEGFAALAALRDEGVVGAVGVGTNAVRTLVRFAEETDIDCALLAGRLTLLDRSAEHEALPLCERRGISVVAGGVFNSGLLADPDGAAARYDYAPASEELRARARALAGVCATHGVSLTAAALQFPLRHPAVVSVLVGVLSAAEVDADVAAFDEHIPAAAWDALAP
jgi:D-threo-aldose 1-dehydrogenase